MKMIGLLADITAVSGFAVLVYGCYLHSVSSACIVGGAIVMFFGAVASARAYKAGGVE